MHRQAWAIFTLVRSDRWSQQAVDRNRPASTDGLVPDLRIRELSNARRQRAQFLQRPDVGPAHELQMRRVAVRDPDAIRMIVVLAGSSNERSAMPAADVSSHGRHGVGSESAPHLLELVGEHQTPLSTEEVNAMKRSITSLVALLVLAIATPDSIAQHGRGRGGPGQGRGSQGFAIPARSGNQSQSLSPSANEPNLLRLRDEEKLARDVYTQLAKTSQLPVFRNISQAETRHMQAVEQLIRSREGGVLNDVPGVFAFPDYQRLYETLVASGSNSPLDALKVGAKIEEMDISDLKTMLAQTNDRQIRQVLQHLMQGSYNHLRAFASLIVRQGANYNAEFLSQAEFDQIAQSKGQGPGQEFGGQRGNQGGSGAQNRGNGHRFGWQGQSPDVQAFGALSRSGANGVGRGGGQWRRGR